MPVEKFPQPNDGLLGKGCSSPFLWWVSRRFLSDVPSMKQPNMEPGASQHGRNMLAKEGREDWYDVLCGLCETFTLISVYTLKIFHRSYPIIAILHILASHPLTCKGVSEPHDLDVSPVSAASPVVSPLCVLSDMAFWDVLWNKYSRCPAFQLCRRCSL